MVSEMVVGVYSDDLQLSKVLWFPMLKLSMQKPRRFLTLDPDGLLVDVSSNFEPSAEFVQKYMS